MILGLPKLELGVVMGTVISELFDESGMSVQAFADKAGLKYGTAYDIAKGISKVENIGAGAFVRIAHVFGKTADELLSDIPQPEPSLDISPEEQELVDLYRGTADFGRRAVMNLAREYREHLPRELDDGKSLVITAGMTDDEVDEAIRRYKIANGIDTQED